MSEDTHRHQREQLAPYLLGALSPSELTDFEHHLGGCAECQADLLWLDPAAEVLATEPEQVEPPSGMRRSVMAAVEEDLAAGRRSDKSPGRAGRRGWFDFSGFSARPAIAGAFALVAVVLIAGVGGVLLNSGDGSDSRVIAGTSTDGSSAVLVSDGDSGTLRISDLERPEEGSVYQAWVQRGNRIEPTESLFLPRSDGTAAAAIPNLNGVANVLVSVEPEGGSSQPTSTPVIAVPLSS